MSITIHGIEGSPPVRGVQLVCDALGIKYTLKNCDVLVGENLTPEFLKMNPLHTVPTIQDGDFILFESHAIAAYLADKYGKNDSFYPKDLKKRAVVNTRLHFNNSILFIRVREFLEPVLFKGQSAFHPEKEEKLRGALQLLEALLGDSEWVAGPEASDGPTIADCCCASTVATIANILPSAPLPPNVAAWLKRCEKTLPNYDAANRQGAERLGKYALSKVK